MTDIVILLKGYSLEAYQVGLYTRSNRLAEAAAEIERLREEVEKSERKLASREEGVLTQLDALREKTDMLQSRVDVLENQKVDSINKVPLFRNDEIRRNERSTWTIFGDGG